MQREQELGGRHTGIKETEAKLGRVTSASDESHNNFKQKRRWYQNLVVDQFLET